ncbi:hypothetical protein JCM10908_007356 [Rhodotorula pacifica]|uniref:uncharacterized protein n=1 Tax=Rhodotorula pacifica TaxID=1495444 RepID=UPI00317FB328
MSLYADAFSQARSPAAAFHTVDLRLSLERALAADLSQLLHERAQLELAYSKSLQRLQARIRPQGGPGQKDSISKEFEALGVEQRTADQQLGQAWTGLRNSLENELNETARVHQLWADKITKDVQEPLRNSLNKGEWARWNAAQVQLGNQTREYESALEKVQKAQAKQTKSSKSSTQSKLLQSQSQLSTLGSQLAAALPAFLDQSQKLDLAHGAFMKEALVRCGTLTADLGRERMEAGERLTVRVLGIDEEAEAQEWALRESIKLGGGGPGGGGGTAPLQSIGEFGEPAATTTTASARPVRSDSVADRSDAASTRSAATSSRTNPYNERQRTLSRPGQAPPAAPLPLPTTDDARSTKEKRGLGSRLSTLIGGGGGSGGSKSSRDRSSSIPNSARYADFGAQPPPPVPTVVTPPVTISSNSNANAQASFDRRASDSSDLLGGGSAMSGGPAPLAPSEPQQNKRKSLMPGSMGLFRRGSKVNEEAPTSSQGGGGFAGGFTAEPEEQVGGFLGAPSPSNHLNNHGNSNNDQQQQRVDAEGYSLPPQGYDRSIQETAAGAGARQRSLLDDDDEDEDEPLGQSRASSVPKLSIVPDLPSKGASPFLPQESEADRLAALESVKNVLGSPNAGGSSPFAAASGGAQGVGRRATARGRRGTGSLSPQGSVPVPAGSGGIAERQDSSVDVPLATVVQQKQRREAPPPPPSSSSSGHRDATALGVGAATSAGAGALVATSLSSSLPSSPATSSFAAVPQPSRTMSILSATSSSIHGGAAAGRPDPFAGATTPGLRASIVETVNVLLKGGEVTRVLVTGEIGLSYRSSGTPSGDLKVRLTGLDSLEKKAPNPALLLPAVDQDKFHISPTITAHGGATTTVFKYQLALPATSTPAPVLVKPVWRCDPAQARAIVTYSVNGASPLFTPATSPFGEEDEQSATTASLEELKLELTLANGSITSFQAKPATASLAPGGRALAFSSLPGLSLAAREQKILASLVTDGQATPGPVNVSWSVQGRTIGNVGVELVGGGGGGGEVDLAEIRRETISGRSPSPLLPLKHNVSALAAKTELAEMSTALDEARNAFAAEKRAPAPSRRTTTDLSMTPSNQDPKRGSTLIPGPRLPLLRGRQRSLPAEVVQSRHYSLVGSAPTIVLRAAEKAGKAAAEEKTKRISIASFASSGSESTGAGLSSIGLQQQSLALSEEERSRRRKRWWQVAEELRDMERAYLNFLETVDELYYQPLLRALPQDEAKPQRRRRVSQRHSMPIWPILGASEFFSGATPAPRMRSLAEADAVLPHRPAVNRLDVERIFANFSDILALSRLLVQVLDESCTMLNSRSPAEVATAPSEPGEPRLGRALLPILPFLKQYSLFVANFSDSLRLLGELGTSSKTDLRPEATVTTPAQRRAWRSLAANARQKASSDPSRAAAVNLDLSGLLLNIVQRVPRYRLLFADLVRFSDPASPDAGDLQSAYRIVDEVATHLDDQIRQHQDDLNILALQQRFKHLEAPLLVPGRRLLKNAAIQVYDSQSRGECRFLFLFSDILILATPRGEVMLHPPHRKACPPLGDYIRISLQEVTVAASRQEAGDTDSRTGIDVFAASTAFTVVLETSEERTGWLEAIREAKAAYAARLATLAPPSFAPSETPSHHSPHARRPVSAPVGFFGASAAPTQVEHPHDEVGVVAEAVETEATVAARSARIYTSSASGKLKPHTSSTLQAARIATMKRSMKCSGRGSIRSADRKLAQLFAEHPPHSSITPSIRRGFIAAPARADSPTSQVPLIDTYRSPIWTPDRAAKRCVTCRQPFGLWRRKHHCRLCGDIFCWQCGSEYFRIPTTCKAPVASPEKSAPDILARACKGCFASVFCPATAATSSRFLASRITPADPELAKLPPSMRSRTRRIAFGTAKVRGTWKTRLFDSGSAVAPATSTCNAGTGADSDVNSAAPGSGVDSSAGGGETGHRRKTSAVDELRRLLLRSG